MNPRAIFHHFAAHSRNAPSNSELLTRFAQRSDSDAFATLVQRFGPLVLGVCRRILGSSADADDAFQSVFLALARQAGSLRNARALPAWLHRVSLRTARKAFDRRGRSELLSDVADPNDPFADVTWRDMRRVLDEELDALPEKLRGPVLLCWLDGLTQDEAAGQLGVSLNTLKRRLDVSRELLRSRLLRRGAAPVLAATAVFDTAGLRADVSSNLADAVLRVVSAVRPATAGMRRLALLSVSAAAAACGLVMVSTRHTPPEAPSPRPVPVAVDRDDAPSSTLPLPPGAVARFGSMDFRLPDVIYTSAQSPDSTLLAFADMFTVRVYEAATWRLLHTFPAHEGSGVWVCSHNLAFSPDGQWLGYTRNGQFAYVWDVKTGKQLQKFDSGEQWRWTAFCAFTPDGQFALSDKEKLRFFDPTTGREQRAIEAPRTIDFSPDGKVFVRMTNYERITPGEKANLMFGDVATTKELFSLNGLVEWGGGRCGLAFAPNGKSIALLVAADNEVQIWDIAKKRPQQTFRLPDPPVPAHLGSSDVGFTADGKSVFVRQKNEDLTRWDVGTGKELPRLRAGKGPSLGGLYALPDEKTLLTPTVFGWVRIWDAANGTERPIAGRYQFPVDFALAPDGKFVVASDKSGRIDLLDATTGKLSRTLREKGESGRDLVLSPDGELLAFTEESHDEATDKENSRLRVLRMSNGSEIWSRQQEANKAVMSLVPLGFAAGDGDFLVLANYPKNVSVWDIGTNKELRQLESRNGNAVLSPDRKLLATDRAGEVKLLDLATGREVKRIAIEPEANAKNAVIGETKFAWAGDGHTLAVSLPKAHVSILDPVTGKERKRFQLYEKIPEHLKPSTEEAFLFNGNGHDVRCLAISRDGKRLVSSVVNGLYVSMWDAETGKQLAELEHGFQVEFAAFTPDGKAIVTFGGTGVGYRWDIEKLIVEQKK